MNDAHSPQPNFLDKSCSMMTRPDTTTSMLCSTSCVQHLLQTNLFFLRWRRKHSSNCFTTGRLRRVLQRDTYMELAAPKFPYIHGAGAIGLIVVSIIALHVRTCAAFSLHPLIQSASITSSSLRISSTLYNSQSAAVYSYCAGSTTAWTTGNYKQKLFKLGPGSWLSAPPLWGTEIEPERRRFTRKTNDQHGLSMFASSTSNPSLNMFLSSKHPTITLHQPTSSFPPSGIEDIDTFKNRGSKGRLGFCFTDEDVKSSTQSDVCLHASATRRRGRISDNDSNSASSINLATWKLAENELQQQQLPSRTWASATKTASLAEAAGKTQGDSYKSDTDKLLFFLESSASPSQFPWIPTRAQIESLTLSELEQVCAQRGLLSNELSSEELQLSDGSLINNMAKTRTAAATDVNSFSLSTTSMAARKQARRMQLQSMLWDWSLREQRSSRQQKNLVLGDPSEIHPHDEKQHHNKQTPPDINNEEKLHKTARKATKAKLEVDSLAEWARTVDLKPLLGRREVIHREKMQGKPAPPKPKNKDNRLKQQTPTLDDIIKVFLREPSFPLNNVQVKELYAAAKRADQQGDRSLAKSILLQLKETTPNDARIYRRLARMEIEEGNTNAARSLLQEGLELHPDNAFLWHGLAQYAASDLDRKIYLRRAIEADPTFPNPYHALGTLQHSQGRIAMAMKTLKKGIEYCPTNHRLHHALGDLYRDAKLLDMAERCYRKALQYGPLVSNGFAFTALAYVAYEQGDIDRCRSWLKKAVKLNDGRHANGWVALAQFEESEGNIDAARATCMAGIAMYERGLLERASGKFNRRSLPRNSTKSDDAAFITSSADPIALKEKMMKKVPVYRSGDRFFNVYRNWVRLEERYGTLESAEELYKRAAIAFPFEWKLSLDEASYYVKLRMYQWARVAFAEACRRAAHTHADPYRLFAEFEMSQGNFESARAILHRGAAALAQASDGATKAGSGLAELLHTWAVCEWRLNEVGRAEVLFDHSLRMTDAGDEGSKLRSFILYSIARLEYYREEYILAQHCIGLCLKENSMPGGNSKIWDLWAEVAAAMGNDSLAKECSKHADKAQLQEEKNGLHSISRLLDSNNLGSKSSDLVRMQGQDMTGLMRRDPWHHKIFGLEQPSNFFRAVRLPMD